MIDVHMMDVLGVTWREYMYEVPLHVIQLMTRREKAKAAWRQMQIEEAEAKAKQRG